MTKKEEQQQWNDLYEYVKNEILKYDEKMKLPRLLVLRLKGLKNGKFIANKNTTALGDYTFNIILMTFKINKFDIINALANKNKFKDESHMINYMMAIVESKLNDTVERIKKAEKSKSKGEVIKTISDSTEEDIKPIYKKKTKDIKNKRLKGLI